MKRFFFIALAVFMSLGFVSCSKDDDGTTSTKELSGGNTGNNDSEGTGGTGNKDPEGTVVVNMRNDGDNWIDIGIGSPIHITSANNFEGMYSGQQQFVSVGKVSGLNAIKSIPATGWASSVSVVPGTGYIAYDSYGSEVARIYVVEYMEGVSGGIIGATIKYQHPIEAAIQLETSNIEISGGYYSYGHYYGPEFSVGLKVPTSYEVESRPDWIGSISCCTGFVRIWSSYNDTGSPRTGNVVLKNSINSVTLSVTQKSN